MVLLDLLLDYGPSWEKFLLQICFLAWRSLYFLIRESAVSASKRAFSDQVSVKLIFDIVMPVHKIAQAESQVYLMAFGTFYLELLVGALLSR